MTTSSIAEALHARQRVSTKKHGLYRYPARFSPDFARAVIGDLSREGDIVLDPFVGGGTTAVEALSLGRRVVAIDINPLAVLLSRAKTTPIQGKDEAALRKWAEARLASRRTVPKDARLINAPQEHARALAPFVDLAKGLENPRQRDVARALLVDAAQWAMDGREILAPPGAMIDRLRVALDNHLEAISTLAGAFTSHPGLRPSDMLRWRNIVEGTAAVVASGRPWNRYVGRVQLVVTSPPYPLVHVLYHRWQVSGRAETGMPYWISGLNDGLGAGHYTMGGRSAVGELSYFSSIRSTYAAVRRLLRPGATVVQLVAFHDPGRQLPMYLAAMADAGYVADDKQPIVRDVPNRRWYFRVAQERGRAHEYLLVHRPRRY